LEFHLATGNAGTGRASKVQSEHGCEFAPVARWTISLFEILGAPCRLSVASACNGQYRYPV